MFSCILWQSKRCLKTVLFVHLRNADNREWVVMTTTGSVDSPGWLCTDSPVWLERNGADCVRPSGNLPWHNTTITQHRDTTDASHILVNIMLKTALTDLLVNNSMKTKMTLLLPAVFSAHVTMLEHATADHTCESRVNYFSHPITGWCF